MADIIKKIAIVGPESTGKSTLAKHLAEHYNTVFVPEYARSYLENKGAQYSATDVEHIAREQLKLEQHYLQQANKILLCDTSLLVIKVWLEYVYGTCPQWILEEINEIHYDLYLLTAIDLKWQPDPLRENPNDREELFDIYLKELQGLNSPFKIVEGVENQRVSSAVETIDKILFPKNLA